MLETSAFRIAVRWPIYIVNSVDKTKFLYTTSPPTQHHSFFRNYPLQSDKSLLCSGRLHHGSLTILVDGCRESLLRVWHHSGPQSPPVSPKAASWALYSLDLREETVDAFMVALYANFTKVYRSIKSMGDCISLQTIITNLDEWSQRNNIHFNASKWIVLTVTRERNPLTYNYHLNQVQLEHVTNEKDVGVTVTRTLSWD